MLVKFNKSESIFVLSRVIELPNLPSLYQLCAIYMIKQLKHFERNKSKHLKISFLYFLFKVIRFMIHDLLIHVWV